MVRARAAGGAAERGLKVETAEDRLAVEIQLAPPVEEVWAALTTPAAQARWGGEHVRLDARLGGEPVERWTDDAGRAVITRGTVEHSDPPALLALSWADEDWPGSSVRGWSGC